MVETEVQSLQRRVTQLEELFSHHELLVQQLNETVVALRADHDRLQAICREQGRRLAALSEQLAPPMDPNEKPPHY